MTLLRTYIVLAVLRGVATVMAVLVVVTSVIEFVGQLNDVGTGDYGLQTLVARSQAQGWDLPDRSMTSPWDSHPCFSEL